MIKVFSLPHICHFWYDTIFFRPTKQHKFLVGVLGILVGVLGEWCISDMYCECTPCEYVRYSGKQYGINRYWIILKKCLLKSYLVFWLEYLVFWLEYLVFCCYTCFFGIWYFVVVLGFLVGVLSFLVGVIDFFDIGIHFVSGMVYMVFCVLYSLNKLCKNRALCIPCGKRYAGWEKVRYRQ